MQEHRYLCPRWYGTVRKSGLAIQAGAEGVPCDLRTSPHWGVLSSLPRSVRAWASPVGTYGSVRGEHGRGLWGFDHDQGTTDVS